MLFAGVGRGGAAAEPEATEAGDGPTKAGIGFSIAATEISIPAFENPIPGTEKPIAAVGGAAPGVKEQTAVR